MTLMNPKIDGFESPFDHVSSKRLKKIKPKQIGVQIIPPETTLTDSIKDPFM